jgi:membrane protease YdiL (CAAX protease family)
MSSHSWVDHPIFALFLIIPIIEWRWMWPRFLEGLDAEFPGVRGAYYRVLIMAKWAPAMGLLLFWAVAERPWRLIYFASSALEFVWIGAAILVAIVAITVVLRAANSGSVARADWLRNRIAFAEPLLPHTLAERHLYWALSVTSGASEEILFRGFLPWYLSVWIGPLPAFAVAALIYGFEHIYMGYAEIPKSAAMGLLLGAVVYYTRSLWPAMILHTAIDLIFGELGFKLMGSRTETPSYI